ncbi:unnamed protein product [Vicia faba]|uniref:Replication factor A C-terminal domain-containing protein n=1 Tax=Vicia faba TaxID=3906 RepID=A0AAV0ZBC2_VICFA|nr:unnamed protein product [Vicia faba]
MSLQITFCATVAEAEVLVAFPFGWYYRSCYLCPCIAHGDIPPFECESGHSTEENFFRYKIEIEVAYAGKSCNFVFWNRECELLLGVSASQLRYTMIQDGIHDALEFPLALDQMLNLEMAFKVKCALEELFGCYAAKNDPFIKELKGPWEAIEVKESVDEAKTDAPGESDIVAVNFIVLSCIEDSENLSNLIVEDSLDLNKVPEVVLTPTNESAENLTLKNESEDALTPTNESAENLTPKNESEDALTPTNESTIVELLDMSDFDLNKLPALDFGVKQEEVKDMIKIYLDYLN